MPNRSKILRLPFVLFNSETGFFNPSDWLLRLLLSCVQLCVFPGDCQTQLVCCQANRMDLEDFQYACLSLDLFFMQLQSRFFPSFEFVCSVTLCSMFESTECPATPVVALLRDTLAQRPHQYPYPQLQIQDIELERLVAKMRSKIGLD